jgi:hypothetical protein
MIYIYSLCERVIDVWLIKQGVTGFFIIFNTNTQLLLIGRLIFQSCWSRFFCRSFFRLFVIRLSFVCLSFIYRLQNFLIKSIILFIPQYPELDDVKIPCSATGSCAYFTHSSTKHVEQKKHDERDGEVCPWWIDDSRIGRLRDVRGVSGLSFQSVAGANRFADVETPDSTLIYQSHAEQQDQNGISKADAVDILINDSHIFDTDLICIIKHRVLDC